MDELIEKVTEVLQDPGQMQQIMEMASSLGLSADGNPGASRHLTLCNALLPYLSPNRRARLERAMELSSLSKIAGQFMNASAGKEDSNLV